MGKINVTILRNYYSRERIKQIAHINGDEFAVELLEKFLEIQEKLDVNKLSNRENFESNYELKNTSLDLWKELLSNAFSFIEFDERIGVERLYDYLKDFRDFEEILYGTNPYYRDHTYHCINLYLMGEYLFRKNGIYDFLRMYTPYNVNRNDAKSAILCIISLTHDLGYPVQILNSINQNILKMYSHYKNIKINELSLEFPLAYEGIFNYLIEILSITQTPLKEGTDYKRSLKKKHGKDVGHILLEEPPKIMQHLKPQVSKALIDYNHGLISCFKLIENLHLFKDNYDISISNLGMVSKPKEYPNKRYEIDERFLISQSILKTIHYHSTTDIRICEEDLLYLWFNILDDICEWSRYTKAKGYSNVPGFCVVDVKQFSRDMIEIHFNYDNYPNKYKPYLQFEALVRKYHQIINHNLITIIKFVISDTNNNRKYEFERKMGENNYYLNISDRSENPNKLLNIIMKKDGLKKLLKKKSDD